MRRSLGSSGQPIVSDMRTSAGDLSYPIKQGQLSFRGSGDSAKVEEPSMRGFVPTPDAIVDMMVENLFDERRPSRSSTVLDPGCGLGAFEDGIIRWCRRTGCGLPKITGIESDPGRAHETAARFRRYGSIEILNEDFLMESTGTFDYVVGNPPYVSILSLSEREKAAFRDEFSTARGRFDLYLLFFEQSLRLLKPGGRLVFITPEKFLYVKTAAQLRTLLAKLDVREILFAKNETFGKLVTYPTITTLDNSPSHRPARVVLRDGTTSAFQFPADGASVLPLLSNHSGPSYAGDLTLADVCLRVSCGIATGADKVFVHPTATLPEPLRRFAYPTISGRQLVPGQDQIYTRSSILVPYDTEGALMPFDDLGAFGMMLKAPAHRRTLAARTCARRKPWYAFHDSVPLPDILRPKLLCKDITSEPAFWIDRKGTLLPQHSVYYLVPRDQGKLEALADFLNSYDARRWLKSHCQRAANGFLRLQSEVLKKLPVPERLRPSDEASRAPDISRKTVRHLHAALVLSR